MPGGLASLGGLIAWGLALISPADEIQVCWLSVTNVPPGSKAGTLGRGDFCQAQEGSLRKPVSAPGGTEQAQGRDGAPRQGSPGPRHARDTRSHCARSRARGLNTDWAHEQRNRWRPAPRVTDSMPRWGQQGRRGKEASAKGPPGQL